MHTIFFNPLSILAADRHFLLRKYLSEMSNFKRSMNLFAIWGCQNYSSVFSMNSGDLKKTGAVMLL
jgi:hypothetical protein